MEGEEEGEEILEEILEDISPERTKKYLRTLPKSLRSLTGRCVKIDSDKPQDVIELLAQEIGITDYKTNAASFWFLDVLALQILRYKRELDDYSRCILISWLLGEMLLIRDNKLSRDFFFLEMEDIFNTAANRISKGEKLLFWEYSIPGSSKLSSSSENEDQSVLATSGIKNPTKPLDLLDIIINATYNMYGSEFRYALIYAVFVEKIEVQTYQAPFLIQNPLPTKFAESKAKEFNRQLQSKLGDNRLSTKSNTKNKKKDKGKEITGKIARIDSLLPPTPPPSLTDEKVLMDSRRFILPLIEAKEAASILHKEG